MGLIAAISRFFLHSSPGIYSPISPLSLSSRVWASAGMILFGLGTAAAAPLQRRYDGGIAVSQPNFAALKPIATQFGPFYSPEFSCLTQQSLNLNRDQNFCLKTLFLTDLLKRPNVCPLQVDSDIVSPKIPREMVPYVNAVKGVFPLRNRAAQRFPENLSAFMFNELGLVDNGNKACLLKEDPSHYLECKKNTNILMQRINEEKSLTETYKTHVLADDSYREKGYIMWFKGNDGNNRSISLGINPENHANYKNAMTEIEKKVLADDCFFKKDPDEIIEFIKELHRTILKNLPAIQPFFDFKLFPGSYRTVAMLVYKKGTKKEEIILNLRNDGVSENEIKLFKNSYSKLRYGDDFQKNLSKSELKVWKKVAYFAPPPQEVERLMYEFVVKIKKFVQQEIHPVALAAWVHCELGRIHPFTDGNGRLARLLLKTILVRGGYEPVIFFDDDIYTQVINEDEWKPGIFANYLAELIKTQKNGPFLMARTQ